MALNRESKLKGLMSVNTILHASVFLCVCVCGVFVVCACGVCVCVCVCVCGLCKHKYKINAYENFKYTVGVVWPYCACSLMRGTGAGEV